MRQHDAHLTETEARLLVTRRLSLADAFRMGLHLYFCEECRKLVERVDPEGFEAFLRAFHGAEGGTDFPTDLDQSSVSEYLCEAFLVQRQVESLGRKIERLPAARRRLLLRNLDTVPLFSTLITIGKTCRRLFRTSPNDAVDLAAFGLELLMERGGELGSDSVISFEASLRALHGNALRIVGELKEAERTLRQSLELSHKTSDPLDRAWGWRYLGYTLADSRRYKEALAASRKARHIFESVRDLRLTRETIFQEAKIYSDQGAFERSTKLLEDLRTTAALNDDDSVLVYSVENLLVLNYLHQGLAFKARVLMPRIKGLATDLGGIAMVRALWLEALTLEGVGDLDGAERLLKQVSAQFTGEYPYDHAVATLDRLRVLLRRGEIGAATRVLSELAPMLRGGRVHAQAVRALRLLARAGLEHESIRRVQSFLRSVQRDPDYTLEDAGLQS